MTGEKFRRITPDSIDQGRPFDWGKVSEDYARFRDIYPKEFYERIVERNLCVKGQRVLDLGTGTGVLPRNMYQYGAKWVGVDIAENQIREAKRLSKDMDIDYITVSVEDLDFPEGSFDVVTACQCFWYFDKQVLLPKIARILKPGGRFCILSMAWLPEEDAIAQASEELIRQYNPQWTGGGMKRYALMPPEWGREWFRTERAETFDLQVPFTRDSWNGRMRACRGIEASLTPEQVEAFEKEHGVLLQRIAPESFEILHLATMLVLRKK